MNTRRHAVIAVVVLVAGALGLAAIEAVEGATEPPRDYGAWAPGVAAPVSAMNRLPATAQVPTRLVESVRAASQATGGDAANATSSLRLLRNDLGVGRSDIYAYSPGEGATCMVFWPRVALCPTAKTSPLPGVVATFVRGGASYPGGATYAGLPDNAPPALAGVAADNVKAVVFRNNGNESRLRLVNNTFFLEVERPAAEFAWRMELEVQYKDGSTRTEVIPDPRA